VELTIKELLEAKAALATLSQQPIKSPKKQERKLAYKIKKNIDKIDSALREYEFNRQKLVDFYAKKDEKGNRIVEGNSVVIRDDEKYEFQNKIQEEQAELVEVDLRAFNEEEIELIFDGYKLSLQVLSYMECLFDDDA